MEATTHAEEPGARRSESFRVAGLLVLLLVANLATVDLFPVVWLDEALHVDPGVSLFLGEGLRSTAWAGQSASETWVGYTPGYAVLLAGWMRVFGFSLLSVRSFGHVLGLAAIGLCWLAVRRHALLRSESSRLLLVGLGACGAGVSFSYRCGRPDPVLFLLAALGFLASSFRGPARVILLLCSGALVPVSGLQGVAGAAVLGALLAAFWPRRALASVSLYLAGCGAGLAAFVLGYSSLGLWERFLEVTLRANGVGSGLLSGAIARLELFPTVAVEDPSSVLLLALCLALLLAAIRTGRNAVLRPALFGAAAAVLVPTILCAAGRWALYYSWMTWVPLLLATLAAREAWGSGRRARIAFRAIFFAAAAVGLPAQLALAVVNRHARSYERVEEVVRAAVPRGSVAYCDAAAYYAVRLRAARLYLPPYNPRLTAAEVRSIDAVVLRTGDLLVFEAPHGEIERRFRPLETPAPPPARLRGMRLHWIYEDYATLRAWEPRREPPAGAPTPPPCRPGAGGAPP